MPIDKEEKRESSGSRSSVKAAWGFVVIIVLSVMAAFVLGAWTKFIVDFFKLGWDLIG